MTRNIRVETESIGPIFGFLKFLIGLLFLSVNWAPEIKPIIWTLLKILAGKDVAI